MELSRLAKISILMFIDITVIISAYILSFFITYSYYSKVSELTNVLKILPIVIITYMATLWVFKMYKSIWSSAGAYEAIICIVASLLAGIINLGIISIILGKAPLLLNGIAGVIILTLCTTARLSLRIIHRLMINLNTLTKDGKENVLIIGAGQCGENIIKEIRKEKYEQYNIVGLIDDCKNKKSTFLNGIKVLGNRNDISQIVKSKNIDLIIFAIAKINAEEKKRIIELCNSTNTKIKVVPGVYELIDGEVSISKMRDVDLKDLLGREEVVLDKAGISEYIENQVVLVTGGGGSIGSELCRQIAKYNPKQLLILDIYENNVYDLQNELSTKEPELNKQIIIASVRDKVRLNEIFNRYKPDIVFHAAAHKHVPLMEDNPSEAIKNNVLGTLNVAKTANKHKVKKFVLISTDKAVNPTNVMGATKRLCEMIIQAIDRESNTEYVAVRFGNVLGSNGSVIPLFQKQIKDGGPVTLTHKKITRYFMLIPEAAQLVLQAGAYAKGGEIFVLDMGEAVRIYDLAENLIKLSGFKPHEDIEIKITGLRPGEKLYEELLMNNDGLSKTKHKMIFIDRPEDIALKDLAKEIDELMFIAKTANKDRLVNKLKEVVPTYLSPEEHARREIAATYDTNKSGGQEKWRY